MYSKQYWLNKGFTEVETEERIKGKVKCVVCDS